MGTIQIDGSTPKLTIGNATAEDALILFDGNAQDFHVGLDDSSDSLVIGLGSALGTTPAMTVNSSQVVTFAQNPVFPDGGVAVADLDIDGATDIGAAIVDADLFIIDDGAGGTNRKVTASRIKTYAGGAVTAINNATANEIVSIGSTTTELDAESKLLFDGTNLVLGNGTAEDIYFQIDGNAFNFNIYLDDSVDGVGFGTQDGGIGTNSALCIDSSNNLTVGQSPAVGSSTPFMIRGDSSSNTGQQTARVHNAGIVFNEVRSGNESVWTCGPDGTTFVVSNCTDDPAANAFTINQSEVVAGDFNDTSDVALKENIVSIDTAIDIVKQLRPVTFDWKRIGKGSTSGFIAQEVELLIPNVVKGDNFDSSDRTSIGKSLNATGVLSHVTKALQEAITKIETLEAKVAVLEG